MVKLYIRSSDLPTMTKKVMEKSASFAEISSKYRQSSSYDKFIWENKNQFK